MPARQFLPPPPVPCPARPSASASGVDVCLLDARRGADFPRQQMSAAAAHIASWSHACTQPLRVHLLMHNLSDGPPVWHDGIEQHAISLPAAVGDAHARIARLGVGSGTHSLWKPFLPWLLPSVQRCIIVDLDVVFMTSPCKLADDFFGNTSHIEAISWVEDVVLQQIYSRHQVRLNGGVVAMDLTRLRASATYLPALARVNRSIGTLGDQTLYARLGVVHPELFRRLPCGLNRQLNTHYPVEHSRYVCSSCEVLHFNGVRVKSLAYAMQSGMQQRRGEPACATLRSLYNSMSEAQRYVFLYTVGDGSCCRIRMKGPVGPPPRLRPLPSHFALSAKR